MASTALVVVATAAAASGTHGLDRDQSQSLQQNSRGSTGETSRGTYSSAFDFRWAIFCKKENVSPDELKKSFVTTTKSVVAGVESTITTMNEGLVSRFFFDMFDDWLAHQPKDDAHQPKDDDDDDDDDDVVKVVVKGKGVYKLTPATCDTLCKAVLFVVNQLLGAAGAKKLETIKDVPSVQEVWSSLLHSGKNRAKTEQLDVQADLSQLMPEDKIKLATKLLEMDMRDGLDVSILTRLNMLYFISHVLQTGSRSEDELNVVQAFEFVRPFLKIGPSRAHGTQGLWHILSGGKVNQCGKRDYMASVMHMNPILCACSYGGMLKLYRWCCLLEEFNDYDYNKGEVKWEYLFKIPIVRSDESKSRPMPYQRLFSGMVKLSAKSHLYLPKPTHFGRGYVHELFYGSAVGTDAADKHLRKNNDVSKKAYLKGPPATTVVLAAGGEDFAHNNEMRHFQPPHTTAMGTKEVMGVVNLLLPSLEMSRAAAERRLDELISRTSRNEAREDRLFTVLGFLKAALFQVQAAVVQAAARPRDAEGAIVVDSPHMASLYKRNPVYLLGPFKSEEFEKVVRLVRRSEDASLTEPCAAMSPITAKFGAAMSHVVRPMNATMLATHEAVKSLSLHQVGHPEVSQAELPARELFPSSGGGLPTPVGGSVAPVPEVPPKEEGKRRPTRDMTAILGMRGVVDLSECEDMAAFWKLWSRPTPTHASLACLENVPKAPWRGAGAVHDKVLRKTIASKICKYKTIVREVEHRVSH